MTTRPISRRTLAAGAAWSVPAVAIASAAPAHAASPVPVHGGALTGASTIGPSQGTVTGTSGPCSPLGIANISPNVCSGVESPVWQFTTQVQTPNPPQAISCPQTASTKIDIENKNVANGQTLGTNVVGVVAQTLTFNYGAGSGTCSTSATVSCIGTQTGDICLDRILVTWALQCDGTCNTETFDYRPTQEHLPLQYSVVPGTQITGQIQAGLQGVAWEGSPVGNIQWGPTYGFGTYSGTQRCCP
ncbi:MAG: hypothetical protein Q4G46_04465 [Propionibacteriaceae bacterium]|nr:hypothetical protein [Propionibacteriaceae bacterium]